mgnify:CR=1 FL=1
MDAGQVVTVARLAIMIALMIMGNWLLNEIVSFMQMLWGSFGQYI